MPPASVKSKKTLPKVRYRREEKDEKAFIDSALVESQLKIDCDLMDVNLICDGGTIQVHAVLLQAVSPLFCKVFESQGESFLLTRDIIMTDFSSKEIKNVVQLLYTGSACVDSEMEAQTLKEILITLQIDLNNVSIKSSPLLKKQGETKSTLRVIPNTTIIRKDDMKSNNPGSSKSSEDGAKRKNKKSNSTEKKKKHEDDDDSEFWDSDKAELSDASSDNSSTNLIKSKTKESNGEKIRNDNKTSNKAKSKDKKYKDEESEEDEWQEPKYSDKKWFNKEARLCQHCKKVYESPAEASMCITGHNRLRCYFCFHISKNTEMLFEHFKKHHKQAGRENCLLCPYCEQTIPFKSISCHVISLHLTEKIKSIKDKNDKKKTTISTTDKPAIISPCRPRVGPGRPSTLLSPEAKEKAINEVKNGSRRPVIILPKHLDNKTVILSRNNEPPPKKQRLEEEDDGLIRAKGYDIKIKRKGIDGRIWLWRIQKDN